jgi:hypothetical protein
MAGTLPLQSIYSELQFAKSPPNPSGQVPFEGKPNALPKVFTNELNIVQGPT